MNQTCVRIILICKRIPGNLLSLNRIESKYLFLIFLSEWKKHQNIYFYSIKRIPILSRKFIIQKRAKPTFSLPKPN